MESKQRGGVYLVLSGEGEVEGAGSDDEDADGLEEVGVDDVAEVLALVLREPRRVDDPHLLRHRALPTLACSCYMNGWLLYSIV